MVDCSAVVGGLVVGVIGMLGLGLEGDIGVVGLVSLGFIGLIELVGGNGDVLSYIIIVLVLIMHGICYLLRTV